MKIGRSVMKIIIAMCIFFCVYLLRPPLCLPCHVTKRVLIVDKHFCNATYLSLIASLILRDTCIGFILI